MKLLIDIPEEVYQHMMGNDLLKSVHGNICYKAVLNGTPIPDNATNGDVLKAMFYCLEKYEYEEPYTHGIALAGNDNRITWFANEWWNSPYQKGGKE